MKLLPTLLLATCLSVSGALNSFAQTGATYTSTYSQYAAGIGITDTYNAGYTHSFLGLNVRRGGPGWIVGTDGANNGGALMLGGITGELRFFTFPTANASVGAQSFSDTQIGQTTPRMVIGSTGKIRIGLTTPTGDNSDYLLSVAGKVVAQSLYITNPNTWADFVFDPTYERMSLSEIEAFIKRNKHLPQIPSAKQVETSGYNVTDMDAKLLQTIEELTLHVIQLSKEVEQLKEKSVPAAVKE